jgi:hypothetical protein
MEGSLAFGFPPKFTARGLVTSGLSSEATFRSDEMKKGKVQAILLIGLNRSSKTT